MKKAIKEKKKRGAPPKQRDKKVDPSNHLWVWQSKRLKEEAVLRNMSDAAMLRIWADWMITALDTARDDGSASKSFDDKFKEELLIDNVGSELSKK